MARPMKEAINIGKAVVISDSYPREGHGQVADIYIDANGYSTYLVTVNGGFREFSEIGQSDNKMAACRIASDDDIRRAKRQRKGNA